MHMVGPLDLALFCLGTSFKRSRTGVRLVRVVFEKSS